MMALYWHEPPRLPRKTTGRGVYTLVLRGPDGRPRCERFDDAADYLARLKTLQHSGSEGVSIDDVLGLLDA